MKPILIVPGYQNSGPGHWQSLWEDELSGARRVEMPNWEHPVRMDWVLALDEAVSQCEEPPLLVGHSLGCMAIVHWATSHARSVHGALLAAPVDAERQAGLEFLRTFAPIPRSSLPFPSIVAGSSDDPFVKLERAREFAVDWGSEFIEVGACGHLNQAAGYGPWPRGEALLAELR